MGNPRVLQELAENTDGVATINANDIGLGLRRVIEHTSSYYLLGYASTNAATDGRYRRIEVRVNQRDVDVTARRGYTAVSDQMQALANARTARAAVAPAVALAIGTLARWDDGRVGAGDEATPTVAAPATPVLGLARLWRIPAIGRPVAQPAGAPIFQRGQRLRIEWQPATTPVAHTVRLLDRRGQTLNPGAAMTAAFDETAGVLRVELHIAALAAGDYAIEVTTGDETERQIVAFRVR